MTKPYLSKDVLQKQNNFLYYGLLAYTVIFYSQLGSRLQILAPLRLELAIGSFLLIVIFIKIFKGEVDLTENTINLAAIFFFLAALITIPFALVKSHALSTFIRLFKFFAIYLMIISCIYDERHLKAFLYVYLMMISLLFVEPFILSLTGKGFIFNNGMWRLAGITGYFSHPNQLGGIASANLPFFYYLMRYHRSKILKIVFFVLIIIDLRVIMLTQSRTAFLGVFTFILMVWLFSKKKKVGLTIILVFLAVLWQLAPQQTKDRFLTLRSTAYVMSVERFQLDDEERRTLGSMCGRWTLIKRSLIAFYENPIVGVGLDCFRSFNGRRWDFWFPPHNTYVQALAEMGIIGFGAFSFLIISIFRNLNTSRRIMENSEGPSSFMRHIVLAVTVYLVCRLVVGMFGQDLYHNFWWISAGLALVIFRITKREYLRQNRTEFQKVTKAILI